MRWTHLSLIPLALGAGLLLVPAGSKRFPEDDAADLPVAADSLDDGPHVFWQDDTRAIAFYLCGGGAPAARLQPADTVEFAGLCADSTVRYRIPTRPYAPARATWTKVPRFLAISDIHGAYEALTTFLRGAGVIDRAGHWVCRFTELWQLRIQPLTDALQSLRLVEELLPSLLSTNSLQPTPREAIHRGLSLMLSISNPTP